MDHGSTEPPGTPTPTSDYIGWQDPDSVRKVVQVVGILSALAIVGLVIVGVAFVISRLRKRRRRRPQGSSSGDDPDPLPELPEVQVEHHQVTDVPHYAIKHVYSITGLSWDSPKPNRTLKQILLTKFLKRKPPGGDLPVVHDALRKDLGRIYVY